MEWNCFAWICWEQVDWSPRPTIYDNEGLLKGWKGCFWDLKAVDFLITYNFSLTMPRIMVCNYICIYIHYIYTHYIYIYTHIFPASVATSSISFLLNATGRFLVIISLTHPRKGFEKKKQIGCNCFVTFIPGWPLTHQPEAKSLCMLQADLFIC